MPAYLVYVTAHTQVIIHAKNRDEALNQTDALDFGDLELNEASIDEVLTKKKLSEELKSGTKTIRDEMVIK